MAGGHQVAEACAAQDGTLTRPEGRACASLCGSLPVNRN
jgi:hypothetical protein